MQLNLFNAILSESKNFSINNFIKELTERLNKMEEELVIDRIEENVAVCEDRKTGKIFELKKEELPLDIKEGNVLKYENGKYVINKEKQEEIQKTLEEKMNNLWE